MAKHNFGVIKATFTNYLNESENLHAKEQFGKFMKMIKESHSLKAMHKFYKNLEEKYIPNDTLAMKYIEENINMLKRESANPFRATTAIQPLVEGLDIRVSPRKKELYEHITNLMNESLTNGDIDVDQLHESFSFVLDYIKNNKPKLSESALIGYESIPKEFLVRKAIEKFNERFSSMNESDRIVLKSIITSDVSEKQRIFNMLKEETVTTLKELSGTPQINEDELNESVNKIDKMVFSSDTYSTDILNLHELRTDITQ